MRDAFGGSFMIMIFLVFIMVYISFTAVALSYAKAFKVKNAVIDFTEKFSFHGEVDLFTLKVNHILERFFQIRGFAIFLSGVNL